MTSSLTEHLGPDTTSARGVNLVDHPWVPAVTQAGTRHLSLREFFHHADDVIRLAPTLAPVETEAMVRFLTSVATLILRRADTVTDRATVDRVLDSSLHVFWLLDPDRPFLQEWHLPPNPLPESDNAVLPLDQLHVHVPGASSSTWCLRPEKRQVTSTLLPVLLVTKWFHGKPGNGAAPSVYVGKQVSGAPAGGTRDTTFHLFGDTMDRTLAMNVPEAWLDTPDLPALLDQDMAPEPSAVASGQVPLWRATWTANRPLVLHTDGNPRGWVIGLTNRPVPNLGGSDVKANAKLVRGRGYAHVHVDVTGKDGTVTTKRVLAPNALDRTEGLLTWYARNLDAPLRDFGRDRVAPPDGARVAFHNEEGDTYGNRKLSQWVVLDRSLLTVTDSVERAALLDTARALGEGLRRPLQTVVRDHSRGRDIADVAVAGMYAAFDPIVLPALHDLAVGRPIDLIERVLTLARVAQTQFDAITHPYLNPATTATVMSARARYRRVVDKARKPFKATTPEETT